MSAPSAAGEPIRILERGAPGWPSRLEHLTAPPSRLWICGGELPVGPAVAVVGSRRASLVGLSAGRALGRGLAEGGVTVLSGMAAGIDGEAHRGALDGGGATLAVLGCGVDVCYPPRHRELRARLLRSGGALVSEDPPGTPPEAWRFPRRNRLIAALAIVVVVVEAGDRSGALSTARWAADLGRDVAACPGSLAADGCRGSNRLIRDGALVCLDVDDLLDAARHAARAGTGGDARQPLLELAAHPPGSPAAALVELLAGGPAPADALGAHLGLDAPAMARLITDAELAGSVRIVAGGLVEAVPRTLRPRR